MGSYKFIQDCTIILFLKTPNKYAHLNASVCGAQEKHFNLRKHNGQWLRYTIQVGDEALMAPLALFHTELLNITGRTKAVFTQQAVQDQYDCEDCFDAEYLKETGRKNGVRGGDILQLSTSAGYQPRPQLPVTADDEELIVVDQDETISNCQSQLGAQTAGGQMNSNGCYHNGQGLVLPLDQAIIQSINRLSSYETKRKMFGSILLVGSSAKLPGLAAWLEQRISQQVQSEVNVLIKGMDAGMVAWKGAAIMSVLESARELWISQNDWQRHGLRVLRERSPFLW